VATKHHRKHRARRKFKVVTPFCEDCGKPIIPYRNWYKKCRACYFKSLQEPKALMPREVVKITTKYSKRRAIEDFLAKLSSFRNRYLSNLLPKVILCLIGLSIFSPFMLFQNLPPQESLNFVVGNPKSMYFYDMDSSCDRYSADITSALDHLSAETGIKFIHLSAPTALFIGGISYTCTGMMNNPMAAGEAESGVVSAGFIIIAWNQIKLLYYDEHTILHETLHTMGLGHSTNPNSIMYPQGGGAAQINSNVITFIKNTYVNNPLSHLNVIPLNLLWVLLFFVAWIFKR
jgi:hypothetical protein